MPKNALSWPKTDAFSYVGGTAIYVDDIKPTGMLYMAVARSTSAHARLLHVDTAAAQRSTGVVRVLEGREAALYLGPMPYSFGDPELLGARRVRLGALPIDEVRYVGEPIAVVVAENPRSAQAAAAKISAEYEELPALFDARIFCDREAVSQAGGLRQHIIAENHFACGNSEEALASAEHRLELTFSMQRSTTAPIEPRGYVASWDEGNGRLTVHASHQQPFQLRSHLAEMLGLSEEAIRVVVPSVGGTFGLKMTGWVEEPLIALMSMMCKRPVKWIESRAECFLGGGREQFHDVRVGFDRQGKITVFQDEMVIPVGAESTSPGWRQAFVSAASFPTAYDVPNLEIKSTVVATNEPPWHSCRGFGKEAPVLVMERTMDLVAQQLGLDPAHVRKLNLLTLESFPHRMPSGYLIDSGDFHAVLDKALSLADYDAQRAEVQRSDSTEMLDGLGIAFEVTPEGGGHASGRLTEGVVETFAQAEAATVEIDARGRVQILSSVTNPGGGNETSLATLAAEELGIDRHFVTVVQGDTDTCPPGTGNASSRATAIGGAAVVLAARALAQELTSAAAEMFNVPCNQITIRAGMAEIPGTGPISLGELCSRILSAEPHRPLSFSRTYRPGNLRPEKEKEAYRYSYPYFSSGAYVARVSVDSRTGSVKVRSLTAVHDCGRVVNEVLVEGQLQGAMAMGIGLALYESSLFDPTGTLATRSFKEYLVPRANDLPPFKIGHHETLSPNTLFGAKGAGETGVGGALAAVANAVANAVARRGGSDATVFPLMPPQVLSLLAPAGGKP
jgi:carbon-monoxide dehydrogenase large subunit